MLISGIFAIAVEVIKSKSTLSTGAVDIEINEYDSNGDSYSEDEKSVMPGEEIGLNTEVHNLGIDCYIRTKIIYKVDNNAIAEENYIDGNYKTWNKEDGYYYNDSVLGKDGTVQIFNKVSIPNDTSLYGKKITLNIIVDAIQSKHFDNDWDGVEIKKSINRAYNIDFDGDSSVIYENSSNDDIKLDDAFFDELGNMVPGDIKSEVITIKNNSKTENEYYLTIDYNGLTTDELKLLNKMKVVIKKKNGEAIVDGSLSKIKNKSLGTYKSGEKEELTISLSLPKNADNDYSKLLSKILFRFYLERPDDKSNNPATGDVRINLHITVFIISSIAFLIVLLIEKKECCKYKKNKGRGK